MSRFPLDTFLTWIDTANPDSGERGSARRTESRMFTRVRGATKPARALSKKIERDPSRARMRSVKRCCEGCVISPASGRALRFASVFGFFGR